MKRIKTVAIFMVILACCVIAATLTGAPAAAQRQTVSPCTLTIAGWIFFIGSNPAPHGSYDTLADCQAARQLVLTTATPTATATATSTATPRPTVGPCFLQGSHWYFEANSSVIHGHFTTKAACKAARLQLIPDATATATPTPTATATVGGVALSWGTVPGAVRYELKVWWDPLADWQLIGAVTDTSYTHSGLTAGRKYYYTIRAVNAAGETSEWLGRKTNEYPSVTAAQPR